MIAQPELLFVSPNKQKTLIPLTRTHSQSNMFVVLTKDPAPLEGRMTDKLTFNKTDVRWAVKGT